MIDLSTWLTKAEAAARLACSERTLDRLVASGRGPERRLRPRQGTKPEPVYNPEDVARLVPPASASPALVPYEGPVNGYAVPQLSNPAETGFALLVSAMQTLADRVGPRRPLAAFLTIKEASAYSGLSQAFLRRLARAGVLPSVRDRALKVRRVDLDNLANGDTISPMAKMKSGGVS